MIHRIVPLFLVSMLSSFAQDGGQLFTLYCSACHGSDGKGATGGAFPPLAGSPWLAGDGERPIKIVLKGLAGPAGVLGRTYNLEMPPQGAALPDDQVAAILTYVRSSWGNNGSRITTEQVMSVRASIDSRSTPWSPEELLKLHPLPVEKSALNGIIRRIFKGDWQAMPGFSGLTPENGEEEPKGLITLANIPLKDGFAATWDGIFEAPEDGAYQFRLDADDAARLLLDGKPVVVVNGIGPMNGSREKSGTVMLKKGDQDFRLEYLEYRGQEGVALGWKGPGDKDWKWLTEAKAEKHRPWPAIPIDPSPARAVVYRNFITGTTPRAIGIGFPGGVNLAYSADHFAPELIWTGNFMDGGHHWTDRGVGAEPPAGENVVTLSSSRALSGPARFKGYKLDPAGNPTFSIQIGERFLLDSWKSSSRALVRTLSLTGTGSPVEILISDRPPDPWITVEANGAPFRTSGDKTTLTLGSGKPVTVTYRWK